MFCVIHFIYHFLSLLHTLNKKEFFSCPIFLTTDAGVIVRLVLHAVVIVTAEMIDGIIAGMIGVTTAGTTDTITGLGDKFPYPLPSGISDIPLPSGFPVSSDKTDAGVAPCEPQNCTYYNRYAVPQWYIDFRQNLF